MATNLDHIFLPQFWFLYQNFRFNHDKLLKPYRRSEWISILVFGTLIYLIGAVKKFCQSSRRKGDLMNNDYVEDER